MKQRIVRCGALRASRASRASLVWVFFGYSSLFAQLLQIRTYGTNDGLPQSEVTAIYQDRVGYLWFGTFENGLARYDGRTFQRFAAPNGALQNAVHEIYQDRRGAMWIGTEEGLVCFEYDAASGDTLVRVFTKAHGLPDDFVTSILEDQQGVLWIGTRGGVCCWQDSGFAKKLTARGDKNNYVNALALAADGAVWCGTQEGVNIWRGDQVETLAVEEGLANNRARALLCDRDGAMWIGTATGLTQVKNRVVRSFNENDGLHNINIAALAQDQRGHLWVGALEGLWTFDPASFDETPPVALAPTQTAGNGFSTHETLRHINRRQGLSNDGIASLWVDYENNLWIGTWGGGACKLYGHYLENYLISNGLPAASVYSFLEDRHGRIWIGTNGGGLAIAAGDSMHVRDTRHGLPHNVIRALDREPSGAIWIGTDAGAVRIPSAEAIFNPESWRVFTQKNGLPNVRINDLYCDANGEVWLGTGGGGALCYSGGHFKTLTTEHGLPGNTIEAIHRDRQDRLWIATIDGLFLQEGQQQKVFRRHDNGLPFDDVYCIFEDRNGDLWFGTRRGGAALYDNGEFRVLNSANGLSNDVVYFINEDRRGRLWFGTNAGVDGFETAGLLNFLKRRATSSTNGHDSTARAQNDSTGTMSPFFHLAVVQGLADRECNARAALGDRLGNLWFGTASGATKLYPDLLPLAAAPPRVHIQAIEADGRFFAFRDDLQLKANSSLTFHFRTLSFINEEYTRSQYYLEGFENSWSAPVDVDNARYTNLSPGKYTFHVRGANAYSVASMETAPLRFEILPPIYRTPWFLLSGLLLLGGLIYGSHRWRLRQMHKRTTDLQITVAEKTHDLKETNEFLANIKDSLPLGLIIVDAKRFVIEANRSGAELFGYENSASLFGHEIHNLLTSDKMTRDMLWAALREEKRAKLSAPNGQLQFIPGQSGLEIEGLRRDGKKVPCRVHACSVEGDDGNLRYIIVTCEDISERRQLEQNLVENQKQLALLDLLAGMGDILNNKLAGVQGYLDLLKNALTKGVARREDSGESTTVNPVEVVHWAHSSAGEMNAILRQLIEFGTYIAKVQAVPLDLRELLLALEHRWNKIIGLKLPEMPVSIWISAVQKIKAGLDEAIRNSREAGATEVVINIEKMEDQSRIRLILTDNGGGISPELVSKVFLPFFKTKATAHPGLGLWKLRQLVQQSGGSVEINFVPKGGTQLVIVLPMATSEQLADKAKAQTNDQAA